jgi:hypothetical protein
VLALWVAQGCADGQQSEPSAGPSQLAADEFREVARGLSAGSISADQLATVLERASAQQGSDLIKAATLPRPSGRAETEALLVRIWNNEAFDIRIANNPVFRLSVASALSRLDPQQCGGCSEYARGLLSAPETDVRSAAALEMGELGSAEDIPRLRQMIRLDDFRVAQGAAAGLTGIAEGDSIPILRELMADPILNAEKRALLTQVMEGVERRQAIIQQLRTQ